MPIRRSIVAVVIVMAASFAALSQTTAFTYQGRLIDNSFLANGTYEMQFRVFDSETAGLQQPQPSPITLSFTVAGYNAVTVTGGVFTVPLDFGNDVFTGADRWLEIAVRKPGDASYTTLLPRKQITSSPYAIYAGKAAAAGSADTLTCNLCITDAHISELAGSKVTGTVANATNALTAGMATLAGNVTGIVQVANGGTGSSTQNFVDLSTNQNIGGTKTFTGTLAGSGTGLSNVPGTLKWNVIPGTTQQAVSNQGYLATNEAQVTITLPASPNIGDIVRVSSSGAGGWKIAQNNGQSVVKMGSSVSDTWTPRESVRSWRGLASSADGTKLVAVVFGGQIYTSSDGGVTWTPRDSNRNWVSVGSSADGTKLVAVGENTQIYTSTDSGVTWTPRETSRFWRSVASSADGTKLVAAGSSHVATSTDSGQTWTARFTVGDWWGVASSTDGTKLVAVSPGNQVRVSTDSGATWTPRGPNPAPPWISVASSADGTKLVAGTDFDKLYTSNDSGLTWTPRENNRIWWSVASSSDGSRLIAAAGSGDRLYVSFDSGVTWSPRESARHWMSAASSADGRILVGAHYGGQIYVSSGDSTFGSTGYVTGGRFSAIELQYVGDGRFIPISSIGTISFF